MMKHPDGCKTTYTLLKPDVKTAPTIIFGTTALKWIKALVEVHSDEVGFFGIVDKRPNNTYFIRDIFYPKHQEANGGTCEISPEGEAIMANWLIDHGKIDDCQKVRFWGHSHHNMGVSPSGQDESQSIEKIDQIKANFVRAICNKKGEMSISFYDYNNQVRFDQIKWGIEDDTSPEIMNQKAQKIIEILSDESVPRNRQFFEIIKIVNDEGTVYEDIKKKVEELKKINIPEKHSSFSPVQQWDNNFGRGYASNWGGTFRETQRQEGQRIYQTSLFNTGQKGDPFADNPGGEDGLGMESIRPLLDDGEVDAMIKEWENME